MPTLADLRDRITDDLARTDLAAQIEHEIRAAIKNQEIERFWFNETRGYTFSTAAGQSDYAVTPSSAIADFILVDWVKATIDGQPVELRREDENEIDSLIAYTGANGQPCSYAYYDRTFRLYPIPQAAYTVRIAGHVKVPELGGPGEANIWTGEGFELIRAAAKARLYVNVLKAPDEAAMAGGQMQAELDRLRTQTSRRMRRGRVKVGYF